MTIQYIEIKLVVADGDKSKTASRTIPWVHYESFQSYMVAQILRDTIDELLATLEKPNDH